MPYGSLLGTDVISTQDMDIDMVVDGEEIGIGSRQKQAVSPTKKTKAPKGKKRKVGDDLKMEDNSPKTSKKAKTVV